jgi:hypothetical protein
VAVSKLSSPVRSRLQRIYAVYDYRRFMLDWSLLSEGGPLSDHTGVRPRPDWPQISYGQVTAESVSGQTLIKAAHVHWASALALNFDRFILSHSIVDEEWHVPNHPALRTDAMAFSATYQGQTWAPIGWQDAAWGDVNVVVSGSVTTVS